MVKICSSIYPKSNEEEYKEYYKGYPYELHDFQKWCVEGIVTGNHVLITAPTGTGKTFGGEFPIQYFHLKGKKVIYTSPIKALSNEKFYAFTNKYPNISVGLITGDIKTNPDAHVLIMTTEILLNKLYQIKSGNIAVKTSMSFDMDIENELGCVVFDEIHMINDEHRGHVWEQTIMLLPQHIQMVGLSATLDDPEKFALWLETKGDLTKQVEKQVFLTKKNVRAVPLIHYGFITTTSTVNKAIKDKSIQDEIKRIINKPLIIQDAKNAFNDANYQTISRTLKTLDKYDIRVKRNHVLNKVAEYLTENEMLPALCYVFSRKQLEKCAQELTANLLEFDSKIPYTVDRECEQIIRKLPNYEEYLHLPEYLNLVKMLRKGVAIHHAGMMPILREMVELLFARGFIKMLFCTETMSVGINLPVKTTIFTDVYKFNGEINRPLYAHEYTQAAGRSGRLGLDKIGHVIHLNNLFRDIDSVSYKNMMNGKPQTLVSKFKISYNLLLNLLDIGDSNLVKFAEKSMLTNNLDNQKGEIYNKMSKLQTELDNLNNYVGQMRTPTTVLQEYQELSKSVYSQVNKKRKETERRLNDIRENNRFLKQDLDSYNKITDLENQIYALKSEYDGLHTYLETGVNALLGILRDKGFLEKDGLSLTSLGKIATQIRELHCLVFAELYETGRLDNLTAKQLVSLFSCFTSIRVPDYCEDNIPKCYNAIVNQLVSDIDNQYVTCCELEISKGIPPEIDHDIHYDLLNYVEDWCESETVEDCKIVLQKLENEKELFLGEFVKALLKINNIACEFEKIAEMTGNISFLSKLREIPGLTLKFVVTNQSLYV